MSDVITLHDKSFEVYLSEADIQARVKALADQINKDYAGKSPIVLCILNGSFIFTADLVRHFSFPLTVEFVRYSSYRGTESTGRVTKILGMKSDIAGKDVLIVEDIIDTGYTLSNAVKELIRQKPSTVRIASLLLKPEALKHDVDCNYIGFSIPNKFVVGYGLDYNELGRDLPSIYQLKE